jgi:hypothetical protein
MKAMITLALITATSIATAGDAPKAAGSGAPATPKADAKADKAAPPAAEMPKPPQELADVGKAMTGTWKCKGQVFTDMKDPTKGTDVAATMTYKLDLNNWWLATTLAGTGKFTLKFSAFTTYDAASKKWYRFGADNMGGARTASSAGPKDGKTTWEGEARSPMGTAKVRETEEMTKDGMHASGEMSMDGKTWIKTHDVVCKK